MRAGIDLIIAGGGLSGSLVAWRLAAVRPELNVMLLEREHVLGGTHTWSFHETDIAAAERQWLEPLVVARWPAHEVRFPGHQRVLSRGYSSITSERLHAVIAGALGDRARFGCDIVSMTRNEVTLASGESIRARIVIDARGGGHAPPMRCGWQTFLGQELVLERDHGLRWPILMDATGPQDGGFRFMYVLPFSPRRVLIEDTLYADGPAIDSGDRRDRIARYAHARGWVVQHLQREEHGALPIPLSGNLDALWHDDTIRIGVRAGMFHPTTGYSLPDAVVTAALLSGMRLMRGEDVYVALKKMAQRRWTARGFFRLLNRLLFVAAEPHARVHVLEQFYRRPAPLIARFYAAQLNWFDRWRLLAGRPPVPVRKAIAQLGRAS